MKIITDFLNNLTMNHLDDEDCKATYRLVISNSITRESSQRFFHDLKSAVEFVTPEIHFDTENSYTIFDEKDSSKQLFIKLR
jgi:hypothetical protein